MALPVTISSSIDGFTTNSFFGGPFQLGSATYVILYDLNGTDSEIKVYKASDPTSSFMLQDTSIITGETIYSADVVVDVVAEVQNFYIYAITNSGLYYGIYATKGVSIDTFTTELTSITTAIDGLSTDNLFVSAEHRNDGDRIVLFSGAEENVSGTNYARIDYVRWEGTSWSSPVAVDDGGAVHYKYGKIIKTLETVKGDDLEDTDNTALGSHTGDIPASVAWTKVIDTSTSDDAEIISNQAEVPAEHTSDGLLYIIDNGGSSFGPDVAIDFTIGSKTGTGTGSQDDAIGVCYRYSGTNDYYAAHLFGESAGEWKIRISKKVSGTWTDMTDSGFGVSSVSEGDIFRVEVRGSDHYIYQNGLLLEADNDTAHSGSGKVGMGWGNEISRASNNDVSSLWSISEFRAYNSNDTKMQFAYYNASSQDIDVKNLNGSNTLSTVDSVAASITDDKRIFGGGIHYLDGTTEKARLAIWDSSGAAGSELAEVYIDDDVVNASLQNVGFEDSTVNTTDIQKHWMSPSMNGKTRYLMYIDDGDDINYASSDDDGTWAADSEAVAGTDINGVFCNYIQRSGNKLAYIYKDTSGNIKYNEVDLDGGASQNLTAPLLSVTPTFNAHTFTPGSVNVSPPQLDVSPTFNAHTFAPGSVSVTAPLLDISPTFHGPALAQSLTAPLLDVSPTFNAHTFVPGSVNVDPPLLDVSPTFYGPTFVSYVVAPLLTVSPTFNAHTFVPGSVTLTAPLLDVSPTFNAHTFAPGSVSLTAPLLDVSPTLNAHTFAPGAVNLAVPLLNLAATFNAHTFAPGSVNVGPPLLDVSPTFNAHTMGLAGQPMFPPLLDISPTFHAHTFTVGSVSVTMPLLDISPSFLAQVMRNKWADTDSITSGSWSNADTTTEGVWIDTDFPYEVIT